MGVFLGFPVAGAFHGIITPISGHKILDIKAEHEQCMSLCDAYPDKKIAYQRDGRLYPVHRLMEQDEFQAQFDLIDDAYFINHLLSSKTKETLSAITNGESPAITSLIFDLYAPAFKDVFSQKEFNTDPIYSKHKAAFDEAITSRDTKKIAAAMFAFINEETAWRYIGELADKRLQTVNDNMRDFEQREYRRTLRPSRPLTVTPNFEVVLKNPKPN